VPLGSLFILLVALKRAVYFEAVFTACGRCFDRVRLDLCLAFLASFLWTVSADSIVVAVAVDPTPRSSEVVLVSLSWMTAVDCFRVDLSSLS
jgi:hypothetical protein